MQRDIGNEIIVAIVAVAVLSFALTFGIILSLSGEDDNGEGTVQDNVHTVRPEILTEVAVKQTETATFLPDETITVAEETPENTGTLAETSSTPTAEAPLENTEIPLEVSDTPTTVENTATIAAPSATRTPRPPTDTPTKPQPTNTSTPTRTRTKIPATATEIPTSTWTPSPLPSNTPFSTAVSSTITNTPVGDGSLGILPTQAEDHSLGILPTPATISTQTMLVPTVHIQLSNCLIPPEWHRYIVQPGDTLFSIARAARSAVSQLRDANCLQDEDRILVGDVLYLPNLPSTASQLSTPSAIATPGMMALNLQVVGCTASTQITNPIPGQTVNGVFVLYGTADLPGDFWYYKLEVRPDFASGFNFYGRWEIPVVGGQLGEIDARVFGSGLHWIRLTVINLGGGEETPCVIPLIFR